jgi:hypothetical protein
MRLFLQGSDTGKVQLDHWLVLTEDGSILAEFHEDTLGKGGLILTMQTGEKLIAIDSELDLFDCQRSLLEKALGTADFDLTIRPFRLS